MSMEPKHFAGQIGTVAVLDEPLRRKLYLFVAASGAEVSRDEAARATRVSRALAAFHLDKLVKAGLLEAEFRRLTTRVGPGAGRPSKLYRRSQVRIDLSLPRRRYELAAQVLAQAVRDLGAAGGPEALEKAARDWGRRMGEDAGPGKGRASSLGRAMRALEACGFEPHQAADGEVVLRNCPFDALRGDRRELICGMNLALIRGLITGLGLGDVTARLAPREGMCCVALRSEPGDA